MQASKCRSCGAAVLWAPSATTGKLCILDADPVPDGNTAIVDGKAYVESGSMFEPLPEGPRYKSHWATCPDARQWRTRTDEKKARTKELYE